MWKGKKKCKILKQIRQEIAKANDIEFITSECRHKGDCAGTCPKCEAELRYLEEELERRRMSGKRIAVAGIVAGALLTSAAGCTSKTSSSEEIATGGLVMPDTTESCTAGAKKAADNSSSTDPAPIPENGSEGSDEVEVVMGEVEADFPPEDSIQFKIR